MPDLTFRCDLSVTIPEGVWERAGYDGTPTEESVAKFLRSAVFAGTEQLPVQANVVVSEDD